MNMGLKAALREMFENTGEGQQLTLNQVHIKVQDKTGIEFTAKQVMNAVNTMARQGEICREGYRGKFIYFRCPSENNPIEDLLAAMAAAEPALRRMSKLWDALKEQ